MMMMMMMMMIITPMKTGFAFNAVISHYLLLYSGKYYHVYEVVFKQPSQ
jgi:hypothetical protein